MEGWWLVAALCSVLVVIVYVALLAVGVVVSLGAVLRDVHRPFGDDEQSAAPIQNRRMRRARLRAVM